MLLRVDAVIDAAESLCQREFLLLTLSLPAPPCLCALHVCSACVLCSCCVACTAALSALKLACLTARQVTVTAVTLAAAAASPIAPVPSLLSLQIPPPLLRYFSHCHPPCYPSVPSSTSLHSAPLPPLFSCPMGSVCSAPLAAPEPPSSILVVAGNAQVTVRFTPPEEETVAVSDFVVTSVPEGHIAHGASSPIIVHGLTNGQAYTFVVQSRNEAGLSEPSVTSRDATPTAGKVAPDAPRDLVASPQRTGSVHIQFFPGSCGSAPVDSFAVEAFLHPAAAGGPAHRSIECGGRQAIGRGVVIDGLLSGHSFVFRMRAVSADGTSGWSASA
jgi:hypothetical protein